MINLPFIYEVAGSLIVILLWVFSSAQILFVGAGFTQKARYSIIPEQSP